MYYEIDSTGGTRVDLILLRRSFDVAAGLEWLGWFWKSCEQTWKLRSHFCHFSRLKRQLQSARLCKKHAGLQVGSGQEQQGNRIGVASRMWHGSAESAHEGILGFHHFLLPSLLGLVCPGTFGARGGHQHGHVWESTLPTRRQPQAGGLPKVQVTQDRQSVLPVRQEWWHQSHRLQSRATGHFSEWDCRREDAVPTGGAGGLCLHPGNWVQRHHRKCRSGCCGIDHFRTHRTWHVVGAIWACECPIRPDDLWSFLGCNGCSHYSALELHLDPLLHWVRRSGMNPRQSQSWVKRYLNGPWLRTNIIVPRCGTDHGQCV